MKTLITVDGKYLGYIRPYGKYQWVAKPCFLVTKRFDSVKEAADYVRSAKQHITP